MNASGRRNRSKFRDSFIKPLLEDGFVVLTIPDKPRSRLQKYRTTEAGLAMLEIGTTGAPEQGRDETPSSKRGGPLHG